MISSITTRLSMQARRSTDPRSSISSGRGATDRDGLMRAYDEEAAVGQFGITDLGEDSDEESPRRNGHTPKQRESIELQLRKSGDM